MHPSQAREGNRVVIRGRGFRQCPLRLLVNRRPQLPAAIAFGYPMPEGFRPGHDGTFVVEWRVGGLGDGEHTLAVNEERGNGGATASLRVRDPKFADRQPRKGEDGKADDGAADESGETPDTARARVRWLERLRGGMPSVSAAVQAQELESAARWQARPARPGRNRVAHRARHRQLDGRGPGAVLGCGESHLCRPHESRGHRPNHAGNNLHRGRRRRHLEIQRQWQQLVAHVRLSIDHTLPGTGDGSARSQPSGGRHRRRRLPGRGAALLSRRWRAPWTGSRPPRSGSRPSSESCSTLPIRHPRTSSPVRLPGSTRPPTAAPSTRSAPGGRATWW